MKFEIKTKCYYPILLGVASLLIFGLLIANGIMAIFVLPDWGINRLLKHNPVLVCIFVGLVQGICEEVGYYYVFSHQLKTWNGWKTPLLFGIGRGGLHFIYDTVVLVSSVYSMIELGLSMVVLMGTSISLFSLSMMDYVANRIHKKRWLCALAVVFHTVMNGTLYAVDINIISLNSNQVHIFQSILSGIIMLTGFIVYKKTDERKINL